MIDTAPMTPDQMWEIMKEIRAILQTPEGEDIRDRCKFLMARLNELEFTAG